MVKQCHFYYPNDWEWFTIPPIYLFGWWFGIIGLFFHSVGNVIIPTDELICFKYVSEGERLNHQLVMVCYGDDRGAWFMKLF